MNIEHPDLIEELQKQLNDLSVKPKDDEEVYEMNAAKNAVEIKSEERQPLIGEA